MTALPNAPEQPGEVEQAAAGARLRLLVRLPRLANRRLQQLAGRAEVCIRGSAGDARAGLHVLQRRNLLQVRFLYQAKNFF